MKHRDSKKSKQTVLVVCGPTASGKTSFALKVASPLPQVNILSVDSRQVYKDLTIVTGKDIPNNLTKNIRFFGIDLFDISDTSNLADFLKYSRQVIQDSIASHTPLIIVGGTGLYLRAITHNLADATIAQNPALRSQIEKLSLPELQDYLKRIDPHKLSSLNNSDVHNPRRLIRAIEISVFRSQEVHGPKASLFNQTITNDINFHWVGLKQSKEDTLSSIRSRVKQRILDGAIEEVKSLLEKKTDPTLPIFSSLGVAEIIRYLSRQINLDELTDLWTRAEMDYARRQTVWFKKQPEIIWYDKYSDKEALAAELSLKIGQINEK